MSSTTTSNNVEFREVKCYAAMEPNGSIVPHSIKRRPVGDDDVEIDVKFCGICHSDVSQVKNEWFPGMFPMVPGHEVVGIVSTVGKNVNNFKIGDHVGVGCLVDSCRSCKSCSCGNEQYCLNGGVFTYNGVYKYDHIPVEKGNMTYGGYSSLLVCDKKFVLRVPDSLDLAKAAPLLCAGITVYSPMMYYQLRPNQRFAVAGLGGLGHMAVKFAKKFGAHVTVLSRGSKKKEDSHQLGADDFVDMTDSKQVESVKGTFNLIIDTIGTNHDVASYMDLLALDGTLCLVGVPSEVKLHPFPIIAGRKKLGGSLIGGIQETQEMLDFCGRFGIESDIELISPDQINEAYSRMYASDVKYRFVIDCSKLG